MRTVPISIRVVLRASRTVLRRAEKKAVSRSLAATNVTHASSIETYTKPSELEALYHLALYSKHGANALEIGSYTGASACYIAAGLAHVNGHLFCLDTWQNETMPEGERDTFAEFCKNTEGVKQYITPLRKHSLEIQQEDVVLPLDLVFIDGDHSYQAAKSDFEKVAPWVALNGVIAFHDCVAFKGVSQVIGEALSSGEWAIGGYIDNLMWIRRVNW